MIKPPEKYVLQNDKDRYKILRKTCKEFKQECFIVHVIRLNEHSKT